MVQAIEDPEDRKHYVNIPKSSGWNALYLAARAGSRVIIQVLLAAIEDSED